MERRWMAVGLVVIPLLALLWGCPGSTPARKPGPVRVVATIPPVAGLVRPLLPQGGTLTALVPPNRSEHGYELTGADVAALTQADVVVLVGLGLEPQVEAFLEKHPTPNRHVIRFADVLGVSPGGPPAAETHEPSDEADHDDDGHHHSGVDPHLWLDPDLCRRFIPAIDRAIRAIDPSAPADAAAKLDNQIAEFDEQSRAALAPFKGKALVTHHSAWARFAAHYGLTIAAVIRPIETVEETSGAVNAAIDTIQKQGIRVIFVEPQFSRKAAERIRERTGVRIGELNPLGDGDWFTMMRANVAEVAQSLEP